MLCRLRADSSDSEAGDGTSTGASSQANWAPLSLQRSANVVISAWGGKWPWSKPTSFSISFGTTRKAPSTPPHASWHSSWRRAQP